MYQRLRKIAAELALPAATKVLSISHSEKLCAVLGLADACVTAANYPEVDLLALPFGDGEFHCIVSDQVLSHIAGNPYQAFSESFRVVREGGLVVHTTSFINPLLACPSDYWRFSPLALRLLCNGLGTVIDADGWGNPYVWIAIALGHRFTPVPEDPEHPFHQLAVYNDPGCPIVTWLVARKKPAVENAIILDRRIWLAVLDAPAQVPCGAPFTVLLKLCNECESPLSSGYRNPVHVSYHWVDPEDGTLVHDGLRTALPFDVRPGETALVNARVLAPNSPGRYRLGLTLVQELVAWFEDACPDLPAIEMVEVVGRSEL
ncbi:MAG: methyltransferase domain-containing protein [Bryobacteraceae bacterium]